MLLMWENIKYNNEIKEAWQLIMFENLIHIPHYEEDASHLSEEERINLGSYYTPKKLVDLCYELVSPYIKPNTIFLDSSAGCGSFLQKLTGHSFIAADINAAAVRFLRNKYPQAMLIKRDNSLLSVSREKYRLGQKDHLIIIGNPPYNDRTSKNRRAKKNGSLLMDDFLARADMGMAFLLSYDKLRADVICVLHPLSYLIKAANFRKLSSFLRNYKLHKGIIFSSRLFRQTGTTPFPILAALYLRGEASSHEEMARHSFRILEMRENFVLGRIETIDGYIRKYPPRKDEKRPSDMGLYFYNFRDSNSLWTSANFTTKQNYNYHITVDKKDFYKYAYLSCYKRYSPRSYIFGNTSPLVEREILEKTPSFRNACEVDTLLNNGLPPLNRNSFRNEVSQRISTLLKKDKTALAGKVKKIIAADFRMEKSYLAPDFRAYFAKLEKKNLV